MTESFPSERSEIFLKSELRTFTKAVRTKRENVHCGVCKSYRERFQVLHVCMLSFFQAHRDEVITMVANPVVDQVISAGLGESKFFVLSRTSKMFIIKKIQELQYLLHAQANVDCAHIYRLFASKS